MNRTGVTHVCDKLAKTAALRSFVNLAARNDVAEENHFHYGAVSFQ
jgi:hypothetical protein